MANGPIKKTNKNNKKAYLFSVGRRKGAVARVRLYASSDSVLSGEEELHGGDIRVNEKPIHEYFRFSGYTPQYMRLFTETKSDGKYIFTVKVKGGGLEGQLHATLHGIARSLVKLDADQYKPVLRSLGYLTRDSRVRERRKVGTGGKARRKKQSPKR